ncbi:hypothetical protein ZIOFF_038698 [Zingiber officinale]|uniref:Uncharacterized protein n=1 Tax=Zingiber officinale TaxID=94328 RepID=A0A8J5L2G8_ZINOF|nr:hypothetical protein ZIOFF_038692 [Zingiber officinale]KAG6498941.1 hypothetical protein ZIOFF_038694 [Zingiber officinale]KAG6498943.1 hypothetical protein ZIOFF_038696 [Zingiber officinale]KAG6498945.1 hypothetical protein ZIOFF_038698 [Zingiber officinale]
MDRNLRRLKHLGNFHQFDLTFKDHCKTSPQWDEILFVITYDEHGGFFDHVPTPVVGVPSPDGVVGPAPFYFNFDRLGVRVPAIFVSPWIEAGTGMIFRFLRLPFGL